MTLDNQKYRRRIRPAFSYDESGRKRYLAITIEYTEGCRLSMHGDCRTSHGQIRDNLLDQNLLPAKKYTHEDIVKIHTIWERWHLNDMRAGTPKQEDFIRNWRKEAEYSYDAACLALDKAGLLYDGNYKYGSSWLLEEVPEDVLYYLFNLPSDYEANTPPDVLKTLFAPPINLDEFYKIIG